MKKHCTAALIQLTEEQAYVVAEALRHLDALRRVGVMLVYDREYDALHAINVSHFSEIDYLHEPDVCPDGMVVVPYYENPSLPIPFVTESCDDIIVAKIKQTDNNLFNQ